MDWIDRITPKENLVVINGRKPPDECRSIVCAMDRENLEEWPVFEKILQAMDISPVYEMFGWTDWFEVKYRAVG